MSKFFIALFLMTLGAAITACNTTRGFGEDVESVGDRIQKSAE